MQLIILKIYLPEQWDRERCWRDDLCKEEEEHGKWQEDRDGEGDLLTGVRWKIEYKDREKRYPNTWDDQINCVEKSLPPQFNSEYDIWVWFLEQNKMWFIRIRRALGLNRKKHNVSCLRKIYVLWKEHLIMFIHNMPKSWRMKDKILYESLMPFKHLLKGLWKGNEISFWSLNWNPFMPCRKNT